MARPAPPWTCREQVDPASAEVFFDLSGAETVFRRETFSNFLELHQGPMKKFKPSVSTIDSVVHGCLFRRSVEIAQNVRKSPSQTTFVPCVHLKNGSAGHSHVPVSAFVPNDVNVHCHFHLPAALSGSGAAGRPREPAYLKPFSFGHCKENLSQFRQR